MNFQCILFSLDAGIARITLNRPDRLNSFNVDMHLELREALARTREGGARVLLLTGAGRGFCAGQDLSERNVAPDAEPVDLGHTIETWYRPLILGLRALEMPVICAVNGVAAGAGFSLTLACDIRIASEAARFSAIFVKRAICADTGCTWMLPRIVGEARALEMLYTGRMVNELRVPPSPDSLSFTSKVHVPRASWFAKAWSAPLRESHA